MEKNEKSVYLPNYNNYYPFSSLYTPINPRYLKMIIIFVLILALIYFGYNMCGKSDNIDSFQIQQIATNGTKGFIPMYPPPLMNFSDPPNIFQQRQ